MRILNRLNEGWRGFVLTVDELVLRLEGRGDVGIEGVASEALLGKFVDMLHVVVEVTGDADDKLVEFGTIGDVGSGYLSLHDDRVVGEDVLIGGEDGGGDSHNMSKI